MALLILDCLWREHSNSNSFSVPFKAKSQKKGHSAQTHRSLRTSKGQSLLFRSILGTPEGEHLTSGHTDPVAAKEAMTALVPILWEWHPQLDGHKFEQALGVGDGQGSLAWRSPWVAKSQTQLSDWTELKNSTIWASWGACHRGLLNHHDVVPHRSCGLITWAGETVLAGAEGGRLHPWEQMESGWESPALNVSRSHSGQADKEYQSSEAHSASQRSPQTS